MTYRLISNNDYPIRGEFRDEAGRLVYLTRRGQPDDIHKTEVIRVNNSDEGEIIAVWENNASKGKPTIRLSGQDPIPTRDFLRLHGALKGARIFRSPEGIEYMWEVGRKHLRLHTTDKENDRDLAEYHWAVKSGKNKSPAYLEIQSGMEHMQDIIFVTVMLMEINRQWTGTGVSTYIDRVFAGPWGGPSGVWTEKVF